MEENLPKFFMGFFLERHSSPSSQRFNINYFQGLGSSQVMNLSFPSQSLGLGSSLSVNASSSAFKLGVRP
jgi:hypothetical protein